MERAFTQKELSVILNEWMRRYIKEPERFNHEFESVQKYIQERDAGKEPSYGDTCAQYMIQIHDELTEEKLI